MSLSNITLSASVRQNLLSLQGTADLLATTQEPSCHRQEGQQRARQSDQLLHRRRPRYPRQRHQQPARQHRQRRAGAAGRQHRHHLAVEPGRYRQVDRQPGAAAARRLYARSRRLLRHAAVPAGAHLDQSGRTAPPSRAARPSPSPRRRRRHAITFTFGATSRSLTLNTRFGGEQPAPPASTAPTSSLTHHDQRRRFVHDRCGLPLRRHWRRPRCDVRSCGTAAVADAVSQATRASLVSQYNQIITQITTTAQDSSFNGINLLNGDSLKLMFDETGKSTLDDHGRHLQSGRSRPEVAHRRHRLPRQRFGQHRADERSTPPASRCGRRRRPSAPTCRSCRSARTSTRT